ncbi:LOW QUALITY PROTEIN: UVRAG isoform 5, partial [Pongo abelii]
NSIFSPSQLRYQHGLGTPDLRQTLPNLKNFMEHGLMVRWTSALQEHSKLRKGIVATAGRGTDSTTPSTRGDSKNPCQTYLQTCVLQNRCH